MDPIWTTLHKVSNSSQGLMSNLRFLITIQIADPVGFPSAWYQTAASNSGSYQTNGNPLFCYLGKGKALLLYCFEFCMQSQRPHSCTAHQLSKPKMKQNTIPNCINLSNFRGFLQSYFLPSYQTLEYLVKWVLVVYFTEAFCQKQSLM